MTRIFHVSRFHYGKSQLLAEASDLGLPPGDFPTFLTLKGDHGPDVEYSLVGFDRKEGHAHYRPIGFSQEKYIDLTILND